MAVWEMMRKIRDDFGTTIFLTTHYLEEADNLSDTVCIMKDGKDVIQGTPLKLRSFIRQDTLQIQLSSKSEVQKYLPQLKEHFPGSSIFARNTSVGINSENGHSDMEKAIDFLLERHIPFDGIQIVQPTLEDIFLRLTAKNEQGECE